MAQESHSDNQEMFVCSCNESFPRDDGYSFNERLYCNACYFKESTLGPLAHQYKACNSCGRQVHIYTIKCPDCGAPVHETGTISVRRPIRTSIILAYAIIALIVVVTGFTMPTFSDHGFLAWLSVVPGMAFMVHGLLGVMFLFLPFGVTTLYRLNAFLLGLMETALGAFLILWTRF